MRPPGIEPRPTDSESDMLTTLPSMHMALTSDQACIFNCDTDKNKNNKKKDAEPKPSLGAFGPSNYLVTSLQYHHPFPLIIA